MPKSLNINQQNCTGCRACEVACSFKHHQEFNPAKSNIHVSIYAEEASFVPLTCTQCAIPKCKEVCPTGALQKSEFAGAPVIKVIEEKCVGCKMCMLACPFGCITVHTNGCAHKCDLCEGEPECVIRTPISSETERRHGPTVRSCRVALRPRPRFPCRC